jgi:hypothetical protein
VRNEAARQLQGRFERREVARESVMIVKARECLIDDPGALVTVGGFDRTYHDPLRASRSFRFGRIGHGSPPRHV